MAADNRSIVITLKMDDGKDKPNVNAQINGSEIAQENDKDSSKLASFFAIKKVADFVSQEVLFWAEYSWDKELSLNDDYVGQRNKRIAMSYVNAGANILTSTLAGAAAGGPVGAAMGAITSIFYTAVSAVHSNIQGETQQNILLKQRDAQLGFTRSRAGWSTNAGSIGEDL